MIITIGYHEVIAQLEVFYAIALAGLRDKTMGPQKFVMDTYQRSLQKSANLKKFREFSHTGLCHKESLAVLSVDVRSSSALAEQHTDETMFKVFQCFLPLMAYITNKCDGEVISLRGDGLISAFGFGKTRDKEGETINTAYEAGMLMIQATTQVLNPFFVTKKVPVVLKVGTSVDIGQVVITKIGLNDAVEVTAYGPAVNNAAKNNRQENGISVSRAAWNSWKKPLPRLQDLWIHKTPINSRII